MKSVLITGGAGFLGSHLADRLLREGARVTCLDDLSTGSAANLAHLANEPRFELIEADVATPVSLDVDTIFNLACPASPVHYQHDPIKTMRTSVLGAINMLDLAEKNGAVILQASTSEVYGDPHVHPQTEAYWGNVNTVGERSCYDEGKRAAETLFADYRRHRGVRTKLVRIFNTYGPRMLPSDGRVVSNFIVQALTGQNLTIYGEGKQTRSFCYVDDLIEAMVRMMRTEDFAGPVNIGNPFEFNMLELAQKVLAFTGSTSQIVYRPLPSDDPRQRKPDISLAKARLDWEPRIGLDEGLERTIADFKTRLNT
ncbi:UDP-glucuronic acid decarboxylase family protein [Devosia aquimaris]|uniref:UDP-glucuronic acid decarboxylase family protein n=1 Tax=Devosia aquimaris TaxID=2866214 RepID=UPI001CD0974E|nr:UDP-glucuronic acid decarboxylase family protein [Devosia sp. CJK-A8-3]